MKLNLMTLGLIASMLSPLSAMSDTGEQCLKALSKKTRETNSFKKSTKEAEQAILVLNLAKGRDQSVLEARRKIWAEHGIIPSTEQLKEAISEALESGIFCTPEVNKDDEVVHEYQQYDTAIVSLTDIILNSGVDTEERWSCSATVASRFKGKIEVSSGAQDTRQMAHELFTKACEKSAKDVYECISLLTSEKKNACVTIGMDPQ